MVSVLQARLFGSIGSGASIRVIGAIGALGVAAAGCGGTACPGGWEAAEQRCFATAETASSFESRVGTGFFGYATYGEKVSGDGEPCEWEPTELAGGEGFDIQVTNDAGESIEKVRVTISEDGTWELTVVPGRTYDLAIESSLEGEPQRIEEGTVVEVAVFFDTGC